jgi:hypothetical protein
VIVSDSVKKIEIPSFAEDLGARLCLNYVFFQAVHQRCDIVLIFPDSQKYLREAVALAVLKFNNEPFGLPMRKMLHSQKMQIASDPDRKAVYVLHTTRDWRKRAEHAKQVPFDMREILRIDGIQL